MGNNDIREQLDDTHMRKFVRALLDDVHALERMLDEGMIESGVRRIGAEQEIFLVDKSFRPTKTAQQILERLAHPQFTNELGLFNLEANLTPLVLGSTCLSDMESELRGLLQMIEKVAVEFGTKVVLCGILPTLDKTHLGLDYMTPSKRFHQLNETMVNLRGGHFKTLIKGVDELHTSHDNVMLEACNTSFQIHFQVGAQEFARLYNLAQVVTAPVLAAAVNSPVLLGHRLWHETRVALFQQSLDVRSEGKMKRGVRQRVSFGDQWVQSSVLEIFREDIARFRSLIAGEVGPSPLEMLDRGDVPSLSALRMHNGTVYRWNRPCYGIQEGRAHLRIENRVLPAGPSIPDQFANAAFYFGLMSALDDEYGDVTKVMAFDDAKTNFIAAARYGLQARFRWVDGKSYGADELILDHLLPLARAGLASRGIAQADSDTNLGILEDRVRANRTGAQWVLDSLSAMNPKARSGAKYLALTAAMSANQYRGAPVHTWELARLDDGASERDNYRTVGQVMTGDLFTVHPEDIVDLAATLMDWEHIRHVPVEDDNGALLGLVSHRELMRALVRGAKGVAVREIMKSEVITVSPDAGTMEALAKMRQNRVSCLPVVEDGRLVGIVTERDFIDLSAKLLDRWLQEE